MQVGTKQPRVIIVGAGFGGITAALALAGRGVDILLIDRTNHHLFQPLLYQAASAALAPSDIATPVRDAAT
jgi:NADH dehydrogenase